MGNLRIILTLLLCLTIPVAGWASVLSGPACPQRNLHGASEVVDRDHASHPLAATAVSDSEHHHEHAVGTTHQGNPCHGGKCACGCGIGACTSSVLTLLVPLAAVFALPASKQAVPGAAALPFSVTRASSPLRPPIS